MENIVTLLALVASMGKTLVDISVVISRARLEGRDVTDEELADLKAARNEAFDKVFG